ncbi:hypothetical protein JTB14_037707 [Gonioctena quinquepunctata]|nr:hypothetical protein JTB14_037707 [Gonioctena quinquepunctata]
MAKPPVGTIPSYARGVKANTTSLCERIFSCIFSSLAKCKRISTRNFFSSHPKYIGCKSYETSDGIKRNENGILTPRGEDVILDVNGYFSFTFPDGTPFSISFDAGENGYRPKVTIGQGPTVAKVFQAPISTAAIASLGGGG